jgi:hypothetical protein
VQFVFVFVATILLASSSSAFSLLGPFEEWQTPALGYNSLGTDVGALKNLGEEYRWNVPVITYGFDASFLDYFGNVGVTAVDQAFAILNYLPPASQMDLENYYLDFYLDTRRFNFRAEADKIFDLKSAALVLTLEQLGLANPERNVWSLRDREVYSSPGRSTTNYYVVNRNFDPRTYLPSPFVNETRYTYDIYEFNFPQFADAIESAVDPDHAFSSIAGQMPGLNEGLFPGVFLVWLTWDDLGGLKYLLSTNNINLETLPDGVSARDGSTNFVNLASRPGVEKLTFQRISEPWYGNPNWSKTVEFTDTYLLDGTRHEQELQRTIRRPDIVFSAGDVGTLPGGVTPLLFRRSTPRWTSASGNAQSAGPGTLQGPVTVTFAKLGTSYINSFPGFTTETGAVNAMPRWGWMTGSIVPVISFPIGINDGFPSMLHSGQDPENPDLISWDLQGYPNGDYTIESSTNLENWIEFQRVSPPSGTYSFTTSKTTNEPVRFFRVTSKAQL